MFNFVFKSKVLGVLEHEFGWDLSVEALGTIYKAPLSDISKAVKQKGGNQYDAAFTFLFCALGQQFPTDISEEKLSSLLLKNYILYSSKTVFTDLHEASYSEFLSNMK